MDHVFYAKFSMIFIFVRGGPLRPPIGDRVNPMIGLGSGHATMSPFNSVWTCWGQVGRFHNTIVSLEEFNKKKWSISSGQNTKQILVEP